MPVLHPMVGGISGQVHSNTFQVIDEEMLCVIPAKILAMTVIDLLFDGAAEARAVLAAYQPRLSTEQYLRYLRLGHVQP